MSDLRAGDLVRITSAYFERANPDGSMAFWEITPDYLTEDGCAGKYITSCGTVGSLGRTQDLHIFDDGQISDLIESKLKKGYVRKDQSIFRETSQNSGLSLGSVGLVLHVEKRRNCSVSTLLVNDEVVRFPTIFLAVLAQLGGCHECSREIERSRDSEG